VFVFASALKPGRCQCLRSRGQTRRIGAARDKSALLRREWQALSAKKINECERDHTVSERMSPIFEQFRTPASGFGLRVCALWRAP
jgi:hypothetical protein